ncbi:MAG: N-acetyltransferase [Desertifilum sp.]|nr:N-acetyltransferase [Desertifilum sp.]
MLEVQAETPDDLSAIRQVISDAFCQPQEANLVETIRHSDNFIPALSLVAKQEGRVVGYLLFSAIAIVAETQVYRALALAPLTVQPKWQKQGIGTRLLQYGLERCQNFDYPVVIVLGHPEFYSRFGFQTASQFKIYPPFEVPDEAFRVRENQPGSLHFICGKVQYPRYFEDV